MHNYNMLLQTDTVCLKYLELSSTFSLLAHHRG